ncbi:MAG: hypothetical protein RL172_2259 [Bacteroidota bacterium]|jgi:hypothetical protein
MSKIKLILESISIWIILVPLFTGAWFIKKLNRDSILILAVVIVATPPQLITAFFELNSGTLNLFYNIYTPVEFILLWLLFKPKFLGNTNKKIFIATGVLYLIASIVILSIFSITRRFVSEWACINNITYILWVLMYVSEIFFFNSDKLMKKDPFTYYLLGIFFYSQCSVLLFAIYYYIQNQQLGYLWIIQSIGNIIMYLMFTRGLLTHTQSRRSSVIPVLV